MAAPLGGQAFGITGVNNTPLGCRLNRIDLCLNERVFLRLQIAHFLSQIAVPHHFEFYRVSLPPLLLSSVRCIEIYQAYADEVACDGRRSERSFKETTAAPHRASNLVSGR